MDLDDPVREFELHPAEEPAPLEAPVEEPREAPEREEEEVPA